MNAIVFQGSDDLDVAIATFAQKNDRSKSSVIREAVAKFIDYDLGAEDRPARRRKYATIEERNAAMRERAKRRRHIQKELLAAIQRGERLEAIQALQRSLSLDEPEVEIDDEMALLLMASDVAAEAELALEANNI